ncbi:hypothetical protein KUL113_04350 [Tenacibaculum sp. KUL113]|nr:hypothetical protein KUL113_04350 [Tenacibaculum sp. KUL113]
MLEVTCNWALHAKTEINTLIWQNARLAKLVLLWRRGHITDQNFIPRIVQPWEPDEESEEFEDFNELKNPNAAYKVLAYANSGQGWRPRYLDIDNFIKEYWPYFSPALNWKIRVNFTEGQVPSIII